MSNQIRFEDGAGYERYMGKWSQLVGASFLDWVAIDPGKRWLDVGCGNGAFTEMVVQRCAPASVIGIDPSEAQLSYARARFSDDRVSFQAGNAMTLPFDTASLDVAVMPLVIFFVPQPSVGVAEMARVVRPGGLVSAYAWDLPGKGFPYAALVEELESLGVQTPSAPNPEASRLDVLSQLWEGAGLGEVRTREITVSRTFDDFADYWETVLHAPSASGALKALDAERTAQLQAALQRRLPVGVDGRITYGARAHAVIGRVE